MMRSVIEAAPMIIRAVGVIAVVASLLGAGAGELVLVAVGAAHRV